MVLYFTAWRNQLNKVMVSSALCKSFCNQIKIVFIVFQKINFWWSQLSMQVPAKALSTFSKYKMEKQTNQFVNWFKQNTQVFIKNVVVVHNYYHIDTLVWACCTVNSSKIDRFNCYNGNKNIICHWYSPACSKAEQQHYLAQLLIFKK